MLGSHNQRLQTWLTSHPAGHERGAIVLFRRFSRSVKNLAESDRFISVVVIEMMDDWILESSENHFTINMRKFSDIYFRCEKDELELGFVHSHPKGCLYFSDKDEVNEKNILHGLSGCNGSSSFLISMVLSEGKWIARGRKGSSPDELLTIRHICILSNRVELHGISESNESPESLLRQEAAFGRPFNRMLQSLRVAVVGVGGTGSPTATLLARSGVGELIIIDGDILDKTNMNRVRGYTSENVGKKKATSITTFINSLGLNVSVSGIPEYLNESAEAIDALSSADIVFGCTDDSLGRDILNQAIYYYCQVLIDVGIAGFVDKDSQEIPYLRDQRGRISCILPESGACLRCQKVITNERIEFEEALKKRPDLKGVDPVTLEKEYYLRGGGVGAPGIGPFTSATADMGVATLMNLIKPYRKIPTDLREDNVWIDYIHMNIHSNEPIDDPECIHCRTRYLLLKSEGKYRLGTPSLGKF